MPKASLDIPKGYEERAQFCGCSVGRDLLTLMERKKTNLAVSLEATTASELLRIARAIGPHICILKTHMKLVSDFTPSVTQELREIAKQQHFLIFEGRKFASLAKKQPIADWAQITNAPLRPASNWIESLKETGLPNENALLLEVGSESVKANRLGIKAAQEVAEFVLGFIANQRLVEDPGFIHLTSADDSTNHSLQTAILEQGNDIVMVGRAICKAHDPATAAKEYRQAAWSAYQQRLATE